MSSELSKLGQCSSFEALLLNSLANVDELVLGLVQKIAPTGTSFVRCILLGGIEMLVLKCNYAYMWPESGEENHFVSFSHSFCLKLSYRESFFILLLGFHVMGGKENKD